MKLRLRFAFALLCFVMFAISCGSSAKSDNNGVRTHQNAQDGPLDLKGKNIRMPPLPELDARYWFNADPGIVNRLKGKVVLIDFWDYTCVNCIRTLPYMKAWYNRYAKDGLVIIGVHSPEFEFAKKRENVADAIQKFGLKYPIVMDNDFKIWNTFGNQYWPAKYLFDKNGILRYVHFGEGEYGNTEEMIQKLLSKGPFANEVNPEIEFPAIMKPIRPTDVPGAVCYLTTPETYLGYERGSIGNGEGYVHNEVASYSDPGRFEKDKFYLVGKWETRSQYVRYAGEGDDGKLVIDYAAAEVNLVIRPDFSAVPAVEQHEPFEVYIYQDSRPVPKEDWGRDVRVDSNGKTFISIGESRMYYLIKNERYGGHLLTLQPASDAFAAYAFTFVTACETPPR